MKRVILETISIPATPKPAILPFGDDKGEETKIMPRVMDRSIDMEKDEPPSMRFQDRDGEILQTIADYGGLVAKRQLKEMFWQGKSLRAMEKRLSKLHQNGLIAWPSREQWRSKPLPEPILWIDWKGMLWLAGKTGAAISPPVNEGENQMRQFENRLREAGYRWLREPRWMQLEHDLAIIDFRLAVEKSLRSLPHLEMEEWIHERILHCNMDVIEYEIEGRDGRLCLMKKGICPDSYFVVTDRRRQIDGSPARARFLFELDNSTHDNPSFGREKAIPGAAYIKSAAFKNRFGYNSGRWLVVTTGAVRMKNLIAQTKQCLGVGARVFLFTTLAEIKETNVLTTPIWHQADHQESTTLFSL
jgi:hypothetical protein